MTMDTKLMIANDDKRPFAIHSVSLPKDRLGVQGGRALSISKRKEERVNDMDAFKELAARMPNMELMNVEQLQGMVFWAGAGTKWARLQIDTAKNIAGMQAQIAAWIREGQAAGELEIRGLQRLGKLAKEMPKAQGEQIRSGGRARGASSSGEPPKWQRLGFKSAAAMAQAEFLQEHPDEVEEVLAEAKLEDDLPSKGAIKAKVRIKSVEKDLAEEKAKNVKKAVKKEPRRMARYYDAVKAYKGELEIAIESASQGLFSKESIHITKTKHLHLRVLMEALEEELS